VKPTETGFLISAGVAAVSGVGTVGDEFSAVKAERFRRGLGRGEFGEGVVAAGASVAPLPALDWTASLTGDGGRPRDRPA